MSENQAMNVSLSVDELMNLFAEDKEGVDRVGKDAYGKDWEEVRESIATVMSSRSFGGIVKSQWRGGWKGKATLSAQIVGAATIAALLMEAFGAVSGINCRPSSLITKWRR